jgi:hypothetical protein
MNKNISEYHDSGFNEFTKSNYILRKYRTNNNKFTSLITASKPSIRTTMKEETTTFTTTKAQTTSKAKTKKAKDYKNNYNNYNNKK